MAINQRKMWSAHLHPLHDDIETVIKTLAGSSCQPLTYVLRRVCGQLADLAAPSALHVVRYEDYLVKNFLQDELENWWTNPEYLCCNEWFLPPANEVWGKVIFSQACVSHSGHFLSGCLVPCSFWGICVSGPMFLQRSLPGQGPPPPCGTEREVRIILKCIFVFVRCLLDAIIASMDATIFRYGDAAEAGSDQKKENAEEIRSSGQTARMLALVAHLINQQPAIKAAFLQICKPGYVLCINEQSE